MTASSKSLFNDVSRALQTLHRSLLHAEARRLATETGREMSPYELLHASINDPELAWLRQMSSLIVEIDTMVDESTHLGATEASAVADKVLSLLVPPADQPITPFWSRFTATLGSNSDLILQHARVKELVSQLEPKM